MKGAVSDTLYQPLKTAQSLFLFLVFSAIVTSLLNENSRKTVRIICAAGITLLALDPLLPLLHDFESQITAWNTLIGMLVPILSGLVASAGYASTAMVYSCTFVGISSLLSAVMTAFLFPFVRIYLGALSIFNLWENKAASKGCSLFLSLIQFLYKAVAVFLGIFLGAQSVLAAGKDTLALKTGKFLLANSIPIVGQAASDALGSVSASLKMLRGSVAIAAVAGLFCQSAPLLLRVMLFYALFSVLGIIATGLGLPGCSDIIVSLAEGLKFCFSLVAVYLLLLFFCIVYMVMVGG